MTDMGTGDGQNFSSSVPGTPAPSSPAPSQASGDERTFRQSEVNDLVGRAKQEAVERYKRESSMASHSQPQQPQYGNQQPYQAPYTPAPQPQQQPYNPGMSEQEIRRVAADEAKRAREDWAKEVQRTADEQNGQRVAKEFLGKIESGKTKYDDFEKTVSEVGFGNFPHIVQLANMVDNTDDVVYELAKNPTKIAAIQNLVDIAQRNGAPPTLAINEMRRLAESLKTNQQASKFKAPNDPLSQMRPSNAGTDNKGALTVSDYKRKYRV